MSQRLDDSHIFRLLTAFLYRDPKEISKGLLVGLPTKLIE